MDSAPAVRQPRFRIYPPVYLAAALAAMWALDSYLPVARLIVPPASYVGCGLFAFVFVAVVAIKRGLFDKAGTTIKPYEESSVLFTEGPYARSRNPIYVLMAVGLVGAAIAFGSLSPIVVVPVFVWLIDSRIIPVEERMLEDTFGETYRDYKDRVRRWL